VVDDGQQAARGFMAEQRLARMEKGAHGATVPSGLAVHCALSCAGKLCQYG
jgi:O-acetylhomoserine/O-acetylserine sulfhydrylase-like pyridoxal-dependent enzyme